MLTIATTDASTVPIEVLWAGAGAVVVAGFLTLFGVWYQTRRTLRAEQERLELQLTHERKLREREELRSLVDHAAAHVGTLVFELIQAITEVEDAANKELDGGIEDLPGLDDLPDDHPVAPLYRRKFEETFAGVRQAENYRSRLIVRLGFSSAAVGQYADAIDGLQVMQSRLLKGEFVDLEVQKVEFGEVGSHVKDFLQICHELIGTELDG